MQHQTRTTKLISLHTVRGWLSQLFSFQPPFLSNGACLQYEIASIRRNQKRQRTELPFLTSPSVSSSPSVNERIDSCASPSVSLFSLCKSFVKPTVVFFRNFTDSRLAMIKLQNGWSYHSPCFPSRENQMKSKLSARLPLHTSIRQSFTAALPSCQDRAAVFLLVSVGRSTSWSLDEEVQGKRQEVRFHSRSHRIPRRLGTQLLPAAALFTGSTPHSPKVSCCSFFKNFYLESIKKYRTKPPTEISCIDKVSTILK